MILMTCRLHIGRGNPQSNLNVGIVYGVGSAQIGPHTFRYQLMENLANQALSGSHNII